jgi:osmotically-inducible protein OsmY
MNASQPRALDHAVPRQEHPMSKSDTQLKRDLEEELRWDPKINANQIGLTVDKGAVSLFGTVDTYAEKWAAEEAVKRVSGVRTVAQDLTVTIAVDHKRNDSDLAKAAQQALEWDVFVPKEVTARVEQGVITVAGQVDWNYERDAAEETMRRLKGVTCVYNLITLRPQPSAVEVKEKIQAALQRQAVADANSINVVMSGGKVTLTGHASSWQSIEDAASSAWAAPGVTEVRDEVKMRMTL